MRKGKEEQIIMPDCGTDCKLTVFSIYSDCSFNEKHKIYTFYMQIPVGHKYASITLIMNVFLFFGIIHLLKF